MRILMGIVWSVIMLSLPAGIAWYLWARLVRDPALPPPWRQLVTVGLILLCVGLPLFFLLARALPLAAAQVLLWPVAVWMGLVLYLLLFLGAGDLARLVAGRLAGPFDPERRLFLFRVAGAVSAGGAALLGAWAVRHALRKLEVKEVQVALPRLPRALDGTTIVQLTDVHVGHTIGRPFVEEMVEKTNALRPDLVAITGDLVEGPVEQLRETLAPLQQLRARYGVFFVTGNHEYYVTMDQVTGVEAWFRELERMGIRVLRNERVSIGNGQGSFDLAGVHDWSARIYTAHQPDLARALQGRDPSQALVLLAHQPRHFQQAAEHGVGLVLSGHTHGGQIWPFTALVNLVQPFSTGLHKRGDTQIYVSPGTGYFGPPMRLGTTAEITRIELRAA